LTIEAGAALINDISAGSLDPNMLNLVSALKVPYIMMHMRGNPQTMTKLTDYENISKEVLQYFSEKIATARALGIHDIVVDPGFGFAKTRKLNFELLNSLELFKHLEVPYLVGLSRKSMIYKTLGTTSDNALNGTTVLQTIALLKGASIVRVHDVKEAQECITLIQNLENGG
jgi:dihydropteroate synthase